MIPKFPEFTAVSKENIKEIKEALKENPPEISDLTSGTLWGYRTSLNYHVSKLEENILIHSVPPQKIDLPAFFLPPIGKNITPDLFKKCLSFLKEKYGTGIFTSVPEGLAKEMQKTGLTITEKRDDADYIYKVSELADMKGSLHQSKRNFANSFYKDYKYEFLVLTKELLAQCLELQEKWCNIKKCMFFKSLEMENIAILEMLENVDLLGLFGAVIKIDGKVQAFGVAEQLNAETAVIHIQKANTEYRGIYQALSQQLCLKTVAGYKYSNWEQDLGNAGLRKSKLSYHPYRLLIKYDASL
ncbi:MAG: hypothetical protein A2252_00655 [Elusimicrobia bacterium RIFOXYA2_FULL_39_19]|nr:MAG: hypothetical protein A2252_00655 [Elusimicrobia bacterium RIFOXYA2_FULL_39_19]